MTSREDATTQSLDLSFLTHKASRIKDALERIQFLLERAPESHAHYVIMECDLEAALFSLENVLSDLRELCE